MAFAAVLPDYAARHRHGKNGGATAVAACQGGARRGIRPGESM